MNKTWIVIITIIITAAAAVGGAYYYLNNKAEGEKEDLQNQIDELNDQILDLQSQSSKADDFSETTTYDESIIEDETADWETYTNDEYGFSFKYPSDLKLVTQNAGSFIVGVIKVGAQDNIVGVSKYNDINDFSDQIAVKRCYKIDESYYLSVSGFVGNDLADKIISTFEILN